MGDLQSCGFSKLVSILADEHPGVDLGFGAYGQIPVYIGFRVLGFRVQGLWVCGFGA